MKLNCFIYTMFIAHGPISYIANEIVQKEEILKLSKEEKIGIALFSIFFGILPDFDLFALSMTNIPPFQHHQYFSHSILFFILLWLLLRISIYIGYRLLKSSYKAKVSKEFLDILQKSFLIGVMSHLLADILFSHSQIFLPLKYEVTILGDLFAKNYFGSYLFSVSTTVEIFLVLIFVYLFYKKFLKESSLFLYGIYTLLGISFVMILFNMYMNRNLYNKSTLRENGLIVYDADYDSLIDYKDKDTDNDGIGNIEEADRYRLKEDARKILEGEYMTVGSNGYWSSVKEMYGAFNSYRLISQVFFNQNTPIEPVLQDYARTEYNINDYTVSQKYADLLYMYMNNHTRLKDFDVNVEQGKLFFVLDESENLVNMGIVLSNDEVGIILPDDTRTSIHKTEDILSRYNGFTLKVER